ncbi:MAG: tetratricopeptide repeat protein, partial [Candidatus Eremiobacteraeota bacterium]|nr:tetratricopeptide repeat protein [Candidatus Eremiobacteraeota bacterium]
MRYLAVLLLLLIIIFTGCSSPEKRVSNLLKQGEEFLLSRKYTQAEKKYREVLSIVPNSPDAHLGLAEVARFTGKPAYAEEMARKAIALLPEEPKAYFT